ncbi:MAG: tetratricopeptide repeat protein [Casimicrobiaceae bacterium]
MDAREALCSRTRGIATVGFARFGQRAPSGAASLWPPAIVGAALALLAFAGTGSSFAHDVTPAAAPTSALTLDPGLGRLHHPVSTRNHQAQAYFDQGLKLIFAFNHESAIRSFERAFELDPKLSMAQWGIALALGPNINKPMDAPAHRAAYAALQKAVALEPNASPAERNYIDALATRYSADPNADLAPLQRAYANAMKEVVRRHPHDDDAAVLYAESLMDLDPWKYWSSDGKPADGTLETVAVLKRVLARDPDHIGANHYYIHALEASPHPERALKAARRLEVLAPSAGHLVHMPAHVYIRTGNYVEAARANVAAVKADERRVATGESSFYLVAYYGHNLHFLAIADAFAGRSQAAIDAASKLYDFESPRAKEVPDIDNAGFLMAKEMVLVKFARWDEILASPEPAFEAPIADAMWHFARTLALMGNGRAAEANAERAKFGDAAATLSKTMGYGNNRAADLAAVALPYLDGRLALMSGRTADAITHLREAVAAEDRLAYNEPPDWYLPSREPLGTALLRSHAYSAAEHVFRDELGRHPASGRALFGLHAALAEEGRATEAAAVQRRFRHAWRAADVALDTPSL